MTINFNIPTSWNELSPRQLKKVAYIIHQNTKAKHMRLLLFYVLVDARWYQLKKIMQLLYFFSNVPATDLTEALKWLFEAEDRTKFIPSFKIGLKTYYAPGDRLHDITIFELATVDDLFLQYQTALASEKEEYLHYIAAVLYREKQNGKRIAYNKFELESRAKRMRKLSLQELLATVITYKGCRVYLFSRYPGVFPKPKPTKGTPKPLPKSSGLGKLILSYAREKDKVFGNYDEVCATNANTFLSDFEEQLKNTK